MKTFVGYFSSIFKSTMSYDDHSVFDAINSSILDDEKSPLVAENTSIDVKAALDTMYLEMASGPDGMTTTFNKKNIGLCLVRNKDVM